MSARKGQRHSAAAIARRPKRAPYDRRWWTKGDRPLLVEVVTNDARDLLVRNPSAGLSGAVRVAFEQWRDSSIGVDYARDHGGKALTAKTVEHRVRALIAKRQAEAVDHLVAEGQARGDYDPPGFDRGH